MGWPELSLTLEMAGNRKEVKGRKKKVFQAINEKVSDIHSIYFGNSNQYYMKKSSYSYNRD